MHIIIWVWQELQIVVLLGRGHRDSFALQSASLALSPSTLHFTSDAGIDPTVWYGEVSYRRSTNLGATWFSTNILSDDDIYSSDYSALGSYTDNTGNTTLALAWRDGKYGGCGFGAGVPFRLSTNNGEEWREEIPLHIDNARGLLSKVAIYKNIIAVVWIDDCNHHTKVRISMNSGESWSNLYDLTSGGSLAGSPAIALSPTAVHVVWEEAKNGWHIFYRRAQLPVTSVQDDEIEKPKDIVLQQNYPNPFNSSTAIGFSMLAVGNVTLKVFDIYGKEVATILNNKQYVAGKYNAQWNAEGYAKGCIFTGFR